MYYTYTESAYFAYSKTAYFYLRRNCLVLAILKLPILLISKTLSFSYTKTAYFLAIPKLTTSFSCTKTVHFLYVRTDHSTCTIIGYRLHYTVRALQTRHLLSVLVRPWLQYSNSFYSLSKPFAVLFYKDEVSLYCFYRINSFFYRSSFFLSSISLPIQLFRIKVKLGLGRSILY
jgi:hypothetical protein